MAPYIPFHADWKNRGESGATTPATAEAFEHLEVGISDAQNTADTAVSGLASKIGTTELAAHNAETLGPHGIANTANLETITGAQAKADAAKARATHTGTQSADTLTDGATNKAFLATERTKLAGIATGATANSADATLLARANHTGTQSADSIVDGATNKVFTATDETKLLGINAGATVGIVPIEYNASTGWPARPTTLVAPVVLWINRVNSVAPANGGAGYIDGVDIILVVSA